ncbi:MAG TPA: hypothetical protein GX507_00535 [Clostridia bacterium]|nr:hypothetical protein [Clostridia bacterium]
MKSGRRAGSSMSGKGSARPPEAPDGEFESLGRIVGLDRTHSRVVDCLA